MPHLSCSAGTEFMIERTFGEANSPLPIPMKKTIIANGM